MKRNIVPIDNKKTSFEVCTHIITKNFWEYYIGPIDEDGYAYGFVMGDFNEWGDVYLPELKPYIVSETENLSEVMPPAGYEWEDGE